ncbi:MAG: NAD(P)/FAD-dependent oxidoreductase [Defluviitaleaceae bacterium]|nr:NAD(P)/FAD-dependent oxidoreductase [Defluviitaleaceae bacterium]
MSNVLEIADCYDTIIIGGGIVGCAAAWALARYELKVLLLEANNDITCGATKANSGIVHAGYDCVPGTLKAKLNADGAKMFPKLAKQLDFPFKVNGSLVLCFDKAEHSHITELYDRSQKNGIPDVEIISAEQAYKLETNLADGLHSALHAKTAAVISPWEAAIAFAENAATNGTDFLIETKVTNITRKNSIFEVHTAQKTFTAKTIINAAGVFSADVHNFIADNADNSNNPDNPDNPEQENIILQRGQYFLLDSAYKNFVQHTLFQLPDNNGKGVLIAPTADGNVIVGPNSENISPETDFTAPEDVKTTRKGLAEVLEKAAAAVKNLPINGNITTFAGVRAKHSSKDFVINEPIAGFVNAVGIDSPGLSAAPAIALMLADFITKRLQPAQKANHTPTRTAIQRFGELSFAEKQKLIAKNPKYGHIVCRCETVTEADIIDAIRRPVGAKNLDAIKRRTRSQAGRCQGGFCSLKLTDILQNELGLSEEKIWSC